MDAGKKETNKASLAVGWVDYGDGIQVTSALPIIRRALRQIRENHIFCNLVAEGYESGQVALVDFDSQRIVWDRPPNWPAEMKPQPLQILFKDRGRLWNKFAVEFRGEEGNTLITSLPQRYIVLQRRHNYRVTAARGSKISFRQGEQEFSFPLENLSANGALLLLPQATDPALSLKIGGLISAISISFPPEENKAGAREESVAISRGRLVRTSKENGKRFAGAHFLVDLQEEKALLSHILRRERELLRRGLAD